MLHLQARVHLQEVEIAVRRPPGTRPCRRCSSPPRAPPGWRPRPCAARISGCAATSGDGHSSITFWCRRCIGALALAQVDQVAVAVAQDLDLDVAGPLDHLLHVERRRCRRRVRLRSRRRGRRMPVPRRRRCAACPCRRRPPRLSASPDSRTRAREARALRSTSRARASVPGTTGTPAAMRRLPRRGLRAHARGSTSAEGPIKTMPASSQAAAKSGVLAQEAVAGMDGLGAVPRARRRGSGRCAGSFPRKAAARCARPRRPSGRAARCGPRRSTRPRSRSPSPAGCGSRAPRSRPGWRPAPCGTCCLDCSRGGSRRGLTALQSVSERTQEVENVLLLRGGQGVEGRYGAHWLRKRRRCCSRALEWA